MLDAEPARLVKAGAVTITKSRIIVEWFDGEGTSCRDIAALAAVWAIGRLQDELRKTLEKPGASSIVVG